MKTLMHGRVRGAWLVFAALGAMTVGASPTHGEPAAVKAIPLTERHIFTDGVDLRLTLTPEAMTPNIIDIDDASHLSVVEYTVEPGFMFPWHTHPGAVLVSVTQGELVYLYAEDCVERPYPAGTAFVDPGFDNVHMAFTPAGESASVIVATFIGIPESGELTLAVDEIEAAALDEKCGIER